MKVYNLCACIPCLRICGTGGWGKLCLPDTAGVSPQRVWLLSAMLCVCILTSARTDGRDSLSSATVEPAFRPRQLILPAALIGAGTFGVCNGWFHSVRDDIHEKMNCMRGGCYFHADDYLQYLPVAANVSMGCLGIKSRHCFKERAAITATAYAAMGIIVNVGKVSFRERRPDSNARNSFPSGHTATAFMGAELVRQEYGGAYGWGAYTLATGIAALRLYNERHWLNDVIAGAGIGILSARIGSWMLPLNRRLFGWTDRTIVAMPLMDLQGTGWGVAVSASL